MWQVVDVPQRVSVEGVPLQVVAPMQLSPDHPVRVELVAGVAVNVTAVPGA